MLQVSVRMTDGTILRVNHTLADGAGAAIVQPGAAARVSIAPEAGIVRPA